MEQGVRSDAIPGEVAALQERVAELEVLLRERERTLRTLVGNLPGFVYRCRNDREWTMEYLSEACLAVTGYRPEELLGNSVTSYGEVIVPEHRQLVWDRVQAPLADRAPYELEYAIRHASGEIRWVWERGRGVYDADGRLLFLEGYIEDATQRRKAEDARLESEARVLSVGNNLPRGMLYQIIRSRDGSRRLSYLSEGVRDLYGCSPEEGISDPARIYGMVAEEDRQRLWEEEEDAFRTGSSFSAQVRMMEPSGEVRWSHFASSPRLLEDGTTCWDGVELDITERKLVEERLRESEARFRAVFEMAGIFLAVLDGEGRLQQINDHFLATMGYARHEALGGNSGVITHPEDLAATKRIFDAVISGNSRGERFEKRYIRSDGGEVWTDLSVVPLRDASGRVTGLIGAGMDITDRKRAEGALRHALEERETLLRELYHRTKNNMQVILALMDRQTLSNPEPAVRIALGEMKGRIAAMALVHEMLYRSQSLSRVNLGEYLGTLARLLLESLAPGSGRVRLSLETDEVQVPLETAIPCGLIANELVTNSLKYAFPDGRSGEIRIGLRREGAEAARLEIADDGAGLPAGLDIARVKTIGLWTVNLLVRQLGGVVSFSGEGGATFRIRFPLEADGGGGEA